MEGEESGFVRRDRARVRVLRSLEGRGVRVWSFLRRSCSMVEN